MPPKSYDGNQSYKAQIYLNLYNSEDNQIQHVKIDLTQINIKR